LVVKVRKFGRRHTHVMLLAGLGAGGQPVHEQVPAAVVTPGVYDVLASPAMVYNCAAGDRIRVAEDGSFEVLRRGGNLCLVLWPVAPPTDTDITVVTTRFQRLGGIVEVPADRRFIVITCLCHLRSAANGVSGHTAGVNVLVRSPSDRLRGKNPWTHDQLGGPCRATEAPLSSGHVARLGGHFCR
jgi:hypothetical protein